MSDYRILGVYCCRIKLIEVAADVFEVFLYITRFWFFFHVCTNTTYVGQFGVHIRMNMSNVVVRLEAQLCCSL